MANESMREMFVEELRDLLHAEKQVLKALPKMAKAASSEELQQAFTDHLQQTKGQIGRLEQIFQNMGVNARPKRCRGMEGILEEGKEMMDEDFEDEVLDAGLIGAAQKVEHYEIAGYGTACAFAKFLGDKKAAQLLQQTLEEERLTDSKLTRLAENAINPQAAMEQ